jgi:hypothetical protein
MDLKLNKWLDYNKNDLISTYCLSLFKHNLFYGFLTVRSPVTNKNA